MEYSTFLIIIIALALIFDFINGFHDAANSIATIVSTKVLTPFQAVVWAAFFNFVAYFIFSDHSVANTIAKTVQDEFTSPAYQPLPMIFSGLLAAIAWNLITWWYGIPSSSSHTLIGGFAGAFIAAIGWEAIRGGVLAATAIFIFVAPIAGMLMAYLISIWFLHSFKKGITMKLVSLGIIISVIVLVARALKFDNLKSDFETYWLQVLFHGPNFKWILLGFIVVVIGIFTLFLSSLSATNANHWFKRFQLFSSAAFSIGHGGNDAQKVMGIISVALIANGNIANMSEMPNWVPLSCYAAIAIGTMSGGWKIVKTMGAKITKVTPFEGVAAETAGAVTLFFTEGLKFPWQIGGETIKGIPVSTTHTITGSIIGVGVTKRISAVKWGVTRKLLMAWVITIPISALMGAVFYWICTACGL